MCSAAIARALVCGLVGCESCETPGPSCYMQQHDSGRGVFRYLTSIDLIIILVSNGPIIDRKGQLSNNQRDQEWPVLVFQAGGHPIPTGCTNQIWPKAKQTDALQIGKMVVFKCLGLDCSRDYVAKYLEQRQRPEK